VLLVVILFFLLLPLRAVVMDIFMPTLGLLVDLAVVAVVAAGQEVQEVLETHLL
jgi:hypothetical protein